MPCCRKVVEREEGGGEREKVLLFCCPISLVSIPQPYAISQLTFTIISRRMSISPVSASDVRNRSKADMTTRRRPTETLFERMEAIKDNNEYANIRLKADRYVTGLRNRVTFSISSFDSGMVS